MRKFMLTLIAVGLAGCAPIKTEVTSVSPSAGELVPLNTVESFVIEVGFDHTMDLSSITAESFVVTGSVTTDIDGTFELANGDRSVVFTTLAPLIHDETITVDLTQSIRSQSGKSLDSFSWNFEVESSIPGPPGSDFLVSSMSPSIESVTAAPGSLLQPTFTSPYDPFVATGATVVVEGSRSGTREVTLQDILFGIDTLKVSPDRPFLAGERVSIALIDGLVGLNGIPLDPTLLGVTVANLGSEWPGVPLDSGTSLGSGTVVFLDYDADGIDEWAVVGGNGIVELQDSTPSGLGNSTSWTLPEPLGGAAVGDFDGDGRVDLVCLGATAERIYLLKGSFSIAVPLEEPVQITLSTASTRIHAAHADEDGIADLLASGAAGLTVVWGSSNDPLTQQTLLDTTPVLGSPVATDLDGDDIIDLAAVQNDGSILILSGTGSGSFVSAGTVTGYAASIDIVAGNLDGDGLRDLLLIPGPNDTASTLLPEGNLNFSLRVLFNGVATEGAQLVDWDGDGMLDALTPDPSGAGLHFSHGLGDGNFEPPVDFDHSAEIRSLNLGDADGDGALDIALEQAGGSWEINRGEPLNLPLADRVHLDDIAANAGDTGVPFSVYIDCESDLQGWTIVLKYDPQLMQISTISSEGTAIEDSIDFELPNIDNVNGVTIVAVIMDLLPPFDGAILPSGSDHEVHRATAVIDGSAASGDYTFGPANGYAANTSAVTDNTFVVAGVSVEPELIDATLTIGGGSSPSTDPGNGNNGGNDNSTGGNDDPPVDEVTFLRGDVNGDGSLDVTDGSLLQLWLTGGGTTPPCLDAADVNDDGMVNLSDPIDLFEFLYQGSNPPPAPYPAVGTDPTADGLNCNG
ncbi:MAG: FG-GAP-like repeat-containing protein [Planctomycetota bacterium]|nr:FG-GAP-like repeat-containing protein [Planctomycetota bacterium]